MTENKDFAEVVQTLSKWLARSRQFSFNSEIMNCFSFDHTQEIILRPKLESSMDPKSVIFSII